jgi:hypothetical protein
MAHAPLQLFGVLALRHGVLRPDQLRFLIEEQLKEGGGTPLGEIARRKGILTARQVRRILELQRTGNIDPDATSFGGLLLQNGFASLDEVGIALQAQRSTAPEQTPPPLGEILVGMGTVDDQQRGAILVAQKRLRGIEPAGELDYETRILPALVGPRPKTPEPQGWLIQETGDELGKLFPLAHKSILGRLPEHDVPVPDMAASRDHAAIEYSAGERRHVIYDLDSRNGTFLNGAQVIRAHPMSPGDHIQIGMTVFRYVAGGGIQGGETTLVTRLGQDAARAAREVATKSITMLKGAVSGAGETARKLVAPRPTRVQIIVERRDALLERVGRAAYQQTPQSRDAEPVDRARRKLEEVRRSADPAVVQWAEKRLNQAVRELGRCIVDKGPAPEGEMPVIVEIRDLEAQILSSEPIPGQPTPSE